MDTEPSSPAEPLQGPQLPVDCGPAHRLRPDIAAALLWGPRRSVAVTADRLIGHIAANELVLAVDNAWLHPHGWGLMAVTSQRVMFLANSTAPDGGPFTVPIEAVLWLSNSDKTNDSGDHQGKLVDLEHDTAMWFTSAASIKALSTAITWALNVHTTVQPGYEAAHTDNVIDDFARYAALRRAHETGALDTESMRAAVQRLFWPSPPTQP
ncbi:hypothetical protein O6P37_15835 [Mycobacterium sp. CPCC 205372]|uniref:YokE-like PH domain-containing protein n=1 Tax=Mycobacterium hippophais TaxID=3016340 RepID=A0ABT4PUX5_9MYCO|nr:hypothetical protein [Mycobacterium hippophais]MCZ8380340.1 hypothetical protein [Mycobacterium hippophais]